MHRSIHSLLLLISLLGAAGVARAAQATIVPAYGECSSGWIIWDLSWGEVPELCCDWLYRDNDLVARNPAEPNFFAPTPPWYVFLEEIDADMCVPVYHNKQYAIRTQVQSESSGWYYLQGSTNAPWVGAIRCSGNP